MNPAKRPHRGGSRCTAIGGLTITVVALVAGLAIAACGADPRPTARPVDGEASPGVTELPLVSITPAPTAPASSPPAATTPGTSPAGTPDLAHGVRATRIKIDRLGVDLAIIEGDGIDAPIGRAAHYPGSAWPDGGSNIYIYGHARERMFISLWKARIGDEIELGLVDGTTRTYVVTKVLPKVRWNAVQYLEPTATEQLTLQTSTSYQPTAPRFIVIAVPAS
jgi:LPXTG-site transpeptidase (sortase) family protein